MDNKNEVLFDPGYAPIVIDSIGQIGYTYYIFSAIPNLKLKRLNFPNTFKKIERLLKINISFYLGCLLWANIISNYKDCEITGNIKQYSKFVLLLMQTTKYDSQKKDRCYNG